MLRDPKRCNLAILCGGPSLERGISLNSARSLLDHLPQDLFHVIPIYVDQNRSFHHISPSHLYSNTPSDFDFKLKTIGTKILEENLSSFFQNIDLCFPVLHGSFGDDGTVQKILEDLQVPFIGSKSAACQNIFLKHKANAALEKLGYPVLPYTVLTPDSKVPDILERTIIKPSSGGSSIGVYSVTTKAEALEKIEKVFAMFEDKHILVEPFCQGKEFTIVVVESIEQGLIALDPTEIEMSYDQNAIFDFRKKYLPSSQTFFHTPARFPQETIEKIQTQAKELFIHFGARDFMRIDGWLTEDGTIYFSDFNLISGLEQNSFLFRQAAVRGWSHEEMVLTIIQHACHREKIAIPAMATQQNQSQTKPVFVLFGGATAERQVSLMSGTNVWLKLRKSQKFAPSPFLLDAENYVWPLHYAQALNHTVEEIYASCIDPKKKMPLDAFIQKAKEENAFVFLGLHGGMGENGEIQKKLETKQIPFNGSGSFASSVCMDKIKTGEKITAACAPDILSLPKYLFSFTQNLKEVWDDATQNLDTHRLIIKPNMDGCSAGIVLLETKDDLEKYKTFIPQQYIPPFSFVKQTAPVEMPSHRDQSFFLEPYIETDRIFEKSGTLSIERKTGWIELTVGILEHRGIYSSLYPSITIAQDAVLSVEEKFQGGTGVNLTPPPPSILSSDQVQKIKHRIASVGEILGLRNYARIDIFFNTITEKMIVIEVNTLPALTPSTVLYHQALAEQVPLSPKEFLEHIIQTAEVS